MKVRRVVTDHDEQGRAIVSADEVCKGVSARPGHERCDLWKAPDGTVFRLVEYQPGVAPRNHRTEPSTTRSCSRAKSTWISTAETVRLRAGDVLVQRSTIHNWVNRGSRALRHRVRAGAAKPVAMRRKLNALG